MTGPCWWRAWARMRGCQRCRAASLQSLDEVGAGLADEPTASTARARMAPNPSRSRAHSARPRPRSAPAPAPAPAGVLPRTALERGGPGRRAAEPRRGPTPRPHTHRPPLSLPGPGRAGHHSRGRGRAVVRAPGHAEAGGAGQGADLDLARAGLRAIADGQRVASPAAHRHRSEGGPCRVQPACPGRDGDDPRRRWPPLPDRLTGGGQPRDQEDRAVVQHRRRPPESCPGSSPESRPGSRPGSHPGSCRTSSWYPTKSQLSAVIPDGPARRLLPWAAPWASTGTVSAGSRAAPAVQMLRTIGTPTTARSTSCCPGAAGRSSPPHTRTTRARLGPGRSTAPGRQGRTG